MSNLSQLLQQVIMGGTAPTTTITSDGEGNNKESTKIVWDGVPDALNRWNFRPESQGPSITASPTNEEFMQNPSQNKFLPTVAGNMWDGVDGAMNDFGTWMSPVVDEVSALNDRVKSAIGITDVPSVSSGPTDGLNAGDRRVDANGNVVDETQNSIGGKPWGKFGPDGLYNPYATGSLWNSRGRNSSKSGGSGGRGALGNALQKQEFRNRDQRSEALISADPDDILGGGTPPVDQEKIDAEKKAAIKEKFKNVKGGDYSIKAVEESAEKAGEEYQDDLLSRYGDYDFAVQAAETRKARLKRTNQVVMQGFMLDVMSQALGKKVGSQNYVENALKALEIDFEIGNADQLQEVTKALYFRPDGTYDPPASKDEAFQALTMMGLTTAEAETISGKVSESKEYYVKDSSNPSGYRIEMKKPTDGSEYTTVPSVANSWAPTVTAQTPEEASKMKERELKYHQTLYPRNSDGYMDEDTASRLINSVTSNSGTISPDFFNSLPEAGKFGAISLRRAVEYGAIDKSFVIGFDSYEEAFAYEDKVPKGVPYAALYKDSSGQSRWTILEGTG